MTKRFMEILNEFYEDENHPEDDDKWTWQPLAVFAIMLIVLGLLGLK